MEIRPIVTETKIVGYGRNYIRTSYYKSSLQKRKNRKKTQALKNRRTLKGKEDMFMRL